MKPELEKKLILPPKGARVLCAVSGGADSMCLLALLLQTGAYELAAAHFEHGIRGEESLRDCAFVESYCRDRGVPCFVGRADVPALAAKSGLGLEEAARKLRYAFLERTAEEEGYDFIATAHSADDNAETVLFHLARGTGPAGLCGIPARRGKIIRPLLALTRAEIEEALAASGTPHVEDSTNQDESYSRNRIRRAVMPVLKELNPAFPEAVARMSRLLRRDEECLDALAEDFIAGRFDGESLPAAELLGLHEAVSSRVVRKLLPRSAPSRCAADPKEPFSICPARGCASSGAGCISRRKRSSPSRRRRSRPAGVSSGRRRGSRSARACSRTAKKFTARSRLIVSNMRV